MDYTVEKLKSFKVIGFAKKFAFDEGYKKIPEFWDEIMKKYLFAACRGGKAENPIQKAVLENRIGEFGVCFDGDKESGKFVYMIAGTYNGGEVPEGMSIYEIPEFDWAKFECTGPLPGSLQTINTAIFNEWLPGNGKYEIAADLNLEWYSDGDSSLPGYKSAIWIPVKEK